MSPSTNKREELEAATERRGSSASMMLAPLVILDSIAIGKLTDTTSRVNRPFR
jgi:hypothetical protein